MKLRTLTRRQFLAWGAAAAATIATPPVARAVCVGIANATLGVTSHSILCGANTGFDYYISPTGDDSNPGTFAQPWSITALGTTGNRSQTSNANGCQWVNYAGKRIGVMPGYYTYGTFSGVQTTLNALTLQTADPQHPTTGGVGIAILLCGGPSSSQQTYIAACDSSGHALNGTPGSPTVTFDFSSDGNGGATGVNSVTQFAAGILIGQSLAGTNGASGPTHWGNIWIRGIKVCGGSGYGWFFGNGIGGTTYGNQVTLEDCEVSGMWGFHDNNPAGVCFDAITQGSGPSILNSFLHDCYSSDQTQYWVGTMSFNGTVATLQSIASGSLNFINSTPFLYGAGLPAGLAIVSLASGTFGAIGSTYNISANVGVISTQATGAGWAGSIPGPYASNSMVAFNQGTVPVNCINVSVARTGAHICKTHQQAVNYRYCDFEFGSFATWSGGTGSGGQTSSGPQNLIWATPAGGSSTMDHCIVVGGYNGGTDFSTDKNAGTNNVTNNTFYLPSSANRPGAFAQVVNDGVAGITNQSGNVLWADASGVYSGSDGGMVVEPATTTNSNNNYLQTGFTFCTAPFGTLYTLAGSPTWHSISGQEASSTTLSSTPFLTTPQALTPSTFATSLSNGAADGSVSSLGYTVGCTFASSLKITTTSLPSATVGTPYSTTITTTGGVGAVTIELVSVTNGNWGGWLSGFNAIPSGEFTLPGGVLGNGAIPQQPETATLVIEATDSVGNSTQVTLTLTVNQQ